MNAQKNVLLEKRTATGLALGMIGMLVIFAGVIGWGFVQLTAGPVLTIATIDREAILYAQKTDWLARLQASKNEEQQQAILTETESFARKLEDAIENTARDRYRLVFEQKALASCHECVDVTHEVLAALHLTPERVKRNLKAIENRTFGERLEK